MLECRCKFAKQENGKVNHRCEIIDQDCVYGFLFPDSKECYCNYKIYPSFTFYGDILKNMHRNEQKSLNGKWVTKLSKDQFTISHKSKTYTTWEVLNIILHDNK